MGTHRIGMALDATFRHRSFGVVLVQFEVETQSHRGHGVLLLAFPFEGCGQGWIHFRNLGWCPVASHDFSVTRAAVFQIFISWSRCGTAARSTLITYETAAFEAKGRNVERIEGSWTIVGYRWKDFAVLCFDKYEVLACVKI